MNSHPFTLPEIEMIQSALDFHNSKRGGAMSEEKFGLHESLRSKLDKLQFAAHARELAEQDLVRDLRRQNAIYLAMHPQTLPADAARALYSLDKPQDCDLGRVVK